MLTKLEEELSTNQINSKPGSKDPILKSIHNSETNEVPPYVFQISTKLQEKFPWIHSIRFVSSNPNTFGISYNSSGILRTELEEAKHLVIQSFSKSKEIQIPEDWDPMGIETPDSPPLQFIGVWDKEETREYGLSAVIGIKKVYNEQQARICLEYREDQEFPSCEYPSYIFTRVATHYAMQNRDIHSLIRLCCLKYVREQLTDSPHGSCMGITPLDTKRSGQLEALGYTITTLPSDAKTYFNSINGLQFVHLPLHRLEVAIRKLESRLLVA